MSDLPKVSVRPIRGWEIVMQDQYGEDTWQFDTQAEAEKRMASLISKGLAEPA